MWTDRVFAGLLVVPFLLGAAAVPSEESRPAFAFADREIAESSGLVVDPGDPGTVWTVNDSGDAGRVFAVDATSGETVGVTTWSDDPTDVEGLAPAGPGEAWVGDIGDNLERRDAVQVARVPVGREDQQVDVPVYELTYPDGAHDAETLLADPTTGRLYLATKSVLGGSLYAAPEQLRTDGPNRLAKVAEGVLPIATDGGFLPDGRHLVVRNYSAAAVYSFPAVERLGTFELPAQQQGEGLAVVDASGRLLLSSEGVGAEVVTEQVPADLLAGGTSSPGTDPSPGASTSAGADPGPADASPFTTESREDRELPEATRTEPNAWPWFLTGLLAVGFIVVLARSLRTR